MCVDSHILAATWNEQITIHGTSAPCTSVGSIVTPFLNWWWTSLSLNLFPSQGNNCLEPSVLPWWAIQVRGCSRGTVHNNGSNLSLSALCVAVVVYVFVLDVTPTLQYSSLLCVLRCGAWIFVHLSGVYYLLTISPPLPPTSTTSFITNHP